MAKVATREVPLAPDEISYHVEAVALQIPGKCGASLKALRENAAYTQQQVASAFHRDGSTVAMWESERSWPPKHLTSRVLQFLNIDESILRVHLSIHESTELDPRLYAAGDPTSIEFDYFLRTRGSVLQSLTTRAQEGSDQAAKLYREWMLDNEEKHTARLSVTKNVTRSAASWTQQSMVQSKPKRALKPANTDTESTSDIVSSLHDKVDSTDDTPQHIDIEAENDAQ